MHKALKGRGPRRAEGTEGQSALKGIVPKREKFTESPKVLKDLNSDKRGRGSRTRRRRRTIVIILGSGATSAFMLWVQLWCNFKVALCGAVSNHGPGLLLQNQP